MKQILLIFSILSCHFSWSQTMVSGQVRDRLSGEPVPGATIRVQKSITALSDGNGWFRLALPGRPGGDTIEISSIGYQPFLQIGGYSAGDWQVFLDRVPGLMQPVEIRAVRASEKAPFTSTTLQAADLARLNSGADLPFLVQQTPSALAYSDAGNGIGYTGIRVRGTDPTRINITLNGIPYNDAESQGVFFVNLPDFSSSVNSIQIQRGAGTSSNGAGSFGATVNMSTNEVRDQAYGEWQSAYGSFQSWKNTFRAGTGLLRDHFTFDARVSAISSDGYIDRASSNLSALHLSGAWLNDRSSLRFNFFTGKEKTYQAWYGVPQELLESQRRYNPAGTEKPGDPYDNETDNYKQDHYQLFFNHRFNDQLTLNAALFYTRGKGYYEQYKASQDYQAYGLDYPVIGQDTIFSTDLVRQLWLDNHFYGNTFSLQYKNRKRELILGGGFSRYDGRHFGEIIWAGTGIDKGYRWYDLDARKTDLNLYLKWQETLRDHLYLFADLQYRHVDYPIDGFRNNPELRVSNQWDFVNPKLGLSYIRQGHKAYISYAVAAKEPNRDDFEAAVSDQPVHETLYDLEIGYEKRNPSLTYRLTGYYMRYRNQLVLTGQINDVGAYARTNIARSYRTGLELEVQWKPVTWFSASGNLTVSSNKVLDFTEYYDDYDHGGQASVKYEKTDLSFSPPVMGSYSLQFLPGFDTEIYLMGRYTGRQFLDNTSQRSRSLDPFFVQDLLITKTIRQKALDHLSVSFQLYNVFGALYEPNGYTYSYRYGGEIITSNNYYPMAGRNFRLALVARF